MSVWSKVTEIQLETTNKVNDMANKVTEYESLIEGSIVDEK